MLKSLKQILEVLHSLGVSEAIIEPDNNQTRIRAAHEDGSIVVYDHIDDHIVDLPMAIQSVNGLLARLNLFDIDKASADMKDNGDIITDIKIKQGRKKASFRFADKRKVAVPSQKPETTPSDVLTFTSEYVKYLGKAISSMSFTGEKKSRTINVKGDGEVLNISITDGEDDSFDEEIEDVSVETERGIWEVIPFQRVMNKASDYNKDDGSANFVIDEYGIATFQVGMFSVMVLPMAD